MKTLNTTTTIQPENNPKELIKALRGRTFDPSMTFYPAEALHFLEYLQPEDIERLNEAEEQERAELIEDMKEEYIQQASEVIYYKDACKVLSDVDNIVYFDDALEALGLLSLSENVGIFASWVLYYRFYDETNGVDIWEMIQEARANLKK